MGWSVIDMHTHIWANSAAGNSTNDERLLSEMADVYALESVVVMPLYGGLCPTREDIAAGNHAVARFAKRDARVKPVATVYPRHGACAMEEAVRWMDAGFDGIKIWVTHADDPTVLPIIELMIGYDKPVIIHAMHKTVGQLPLESDPTHMANLARMYPESKLVMAHIGGNFIYSCEIIEPYANVWTDSSGSFTETGMLEHAVRLLGPDRVMFGTDAPGADYVCNLAKVLAADLPPDTTRKILGENAKSLWGWQ